jgi:hypothetical protein
MPAPKSKPAKPRVPFATAMSELEAAGTAQARKTYLRHGATEPLFGVSFATLKKLVKQIGVDHELAVALWASGNHDARNLAVKVADPARMTAADLDRWARGTNGRVMTGYVAMLAADGPHAHAVIDAWLGASEPVLRSAGWSLVGRLAMSDPAVDDARFDALLDRIAAGIHAAPNVEREPMNAALIAIGCRSAALRAKAEAVAARVGTVEVDHGDTACETPDAAVYIAKSWAWSLGKGFTSPAAQEQTREPMRLRC